METKNNFEITLNLDNFEETIQKLVNEKKNFIAYMYGSKKDGKSWCPDCELAEPFVLKMIPYVIEMESKKEVYFVHLPMDRDKRQPYKDNKTLNAQRVPTLAYYFKGKEMGRIVEGEMDSLEKVEGFIKQIYEDVE